MFHIVFSLASRFLFLRNVVQGFAHGILALRNLHVISSHLIPALPAPQSILLLDPPAAFADIQDQIILPYVSVASAELIAIESQSPVFSSSISSYQSSLMLVTPSKLPDFVPIFIILAIISGFLVFLPEIVCHLMNVAKVPSAFTPASRFFAKLFRTNPLLYLVPDYVPAVLAPAQAFICLTTLRISWSGSVRIQYPSYTIHIDRICSPRLDSSSPPSGSRPFFSQIAKPLMQYVHFRNVCGERISHRDALGCQLS